MQHAQLQINLFHLSGLLYISNYVIHLQVRIITLNQNTRLVN